MTMQSETYEGLKTHIQAFVATNPQGIEFHRMNHTTLRFCWDVLWASKYDVMSLYRAGLNDSHITTALKRILI